MATRRYRVITQATAQRISWEGIVDTIENQRTSVNGQLMIVERLEGYAMNSRWIPHAAALILMDSPEWTIIQDVE